MPKHLRGLIKCLWMHVFTTSAGINMMSRHVPMHVAVRLSLLRTSRRAGMLPLRSALRGSPFWPAARRAELMRFCSYPELSATLLYTLKSIQLMYVCSMIVLSTVICDSFSVSLTNIVSFFGVFRTAAYVRGAAIASNGRRPNLPKPSFMPVMSPVPPPPPDWHWSILFCLVRSDSVLENGRPVLLDMWSGLLEKFLIFDNKK